MHTHTHAHLHRIPKGNLFNTRSVLFFRLKCRSVSPSESYMPQSGFLHCVFFLVFHSHSCEQLMNMISWISTLSFKSKPKTEKLLNEVNEWHSSQSTRYPACHYWISTVNVFNGSQHRKPNNRIYGFLVCACVYAYECSLVVKRKSIDY